MSNDQPTCDSCGGQLEFRVDGSAQGWYCPSCDTWAMVTTCLSAIATEPTVYHLFVVNGDPDNIEQMKAVSAASARNLIWSKKTLSSVDTEVVAGRAPEIAKAAEQLRASGISIRIEPEFPYAIS
ncbi:hypothetical protein [Paracoccus zhejiangensis]|uniref:Uncharacterized protein n=1 Tax=Paracoccus zhejiangensis TaxID=1077935 RepID=A0A2H5EZ86_9RHOB|nr:hypothetical protein [Paracoccus zhejiangensis]AUH64616.1 hypothetical protein CX676_10935 [Paracoccus zhejiangensis]